MFVALRPSENWIPSRRSSGSSPSSGVRRRRRGWWAKKNGCPNSSSSMRPRNSTSNSNPSGKAVTAGIQSAALSDRPITRLSATVLPITASRAPAQGRRGGSGGGSGGGEGGSKKDDIALVFHRCGSTANSLAYARVLHVESPDAPRGGYLVLARGSNTSPESVPAFPDAGRRFVRRRLGACRAARRQRGIGVYCASSVVARCSRRTRSDRSGRG